MRVRYVLEYERCNRSKKHNTYFALHPGPVLFILNYGPSIMLTLKYAYGECKKQYLVRDGLGGPMSFLKTKISGRSSRNKYAYI
jgi:hypothetical protein